MKPHPKNAEIYGQDEDVSDLVEKIKRSGQVHTLVVTSNGTILAGHRRLRACKELGIEEVDVEIVDFDTPEQEIEYLIDNNATRDKTNEQKAKEAIALKETLEILAEKRKKSKLKQNQSSEVPNLAQRGLTTPEAVDPELDGKDISDPGRTRDIIASRVGFKSGQETDRAIKTVNKINELKEEGRDEEAKLIQGVMNNRNISAAQELAKNIDNIKLSDEEKEEIRSGRKSPHSFIMKAAKSEIEQQEIIPKSVEADDNIKKMKKELAAIQKRYQDYLMSFQTDIEWLLDKSFCYGDEDVSGKTHSDLRNCLEKFKGINNTMKKMEIDEFGVICINNE